MHIQTFLEDFQLVQLQLFDDNWVDHYLLPLNLVLSKAQITTL